MGCIVFHMMRWLAEEDPFQLKGLEERAPPLPEEKEPVASSTAAQEAEPQNGADKSSRDASHAEVGASLTAMELVRMQCLAG